MKTISRVNDRKRAVNLTLNEELVQQAKGMTDNLSAVVCEFVRSAPANIADLRGSSCEWISGWKSGSRRAQ